MLAVSALTGLHILAVGKGPRWTSPLLLGDHLFDMMFALLIFLYAMALGQRLTARWRNLAGDPLSDGLATLGLGLGEHSLTILGMGALPPLLRLGLCRRALCGANLVAACTDVENDLGMTAAARSVKRGCKARLPTAPTLGQRIIVLVLALALATLWLDSTLPAREWSGNGMGMGPSDPITLVEGSNVPLLQAHAASCSTSDVALANAPSGCGNVGPGRL